MTIEPTTPPRRTLKDRIQADEFRRLGLEIVCRSCGQPFTPTPADFRRGLWRVCPPCRDGPEPQGTPESS